MTDKEIIKALECCKSLDAGTCKSCIFGFKNRHPNSNCINELCENALDLINSQQAEIEHIGKLYNKRTNLCEEQRRQLEELDLVLCNYPYIVLLRNGAIATKNYEEYSKLLSTISAEAIKEFADRLKDYFREKAIETFGDVADSVEYLTIDTEQTEIDVDNLVKEMVGEDK